MCDLRFEIGWQVYDVDRRERAFLHTDTASYAQALRNKSYLRLWGNFYAELPCSHDWTRLLAFLTAFLYRSVSRVSAGVRRSQ